ncbi:hypothetical protein NE237_031384 [Protea cynaroides]|uniref:Uncharacterized protein n=1 Tax=Protea cynaroides TaxID=273540 RepID=A0A9Q0R2G1_9MAGN|nr:hypothetical protein NE237_031384 [Protea cynaroides]
MASVSSFGSGEWITGNNKIQGMQVSDVDVALIESFLDEPLFEESEDEKFQCMIQSLEAEIDSNMNDGVKPFDFGVCPVEDLGVLEDCKDCWGSSSTFPGHDLDWVDVEMGSWYLGSSADELLDMLEFGKIGDYSQFCNEAVPPQEREYGSLWQETYDTIM